MSGLLIGLIGHPLETGPLTHATMPIHLTGIPWVLEIHLLATLLPCVVRMPTAVIWVGSASPLAQQAILIVTKAEFVVCARRRPVGLAGGSHLVVGQPSGLQFTHNRRSRELGQTPVDAPHGLHLATAGHWSTALVRVMIWTWH